MNTLLHIDDTGVAAPAHLIGSDARLDVFRNHGENIGRQSARHGGPWRSRSTRGSLFPSSFHHLIMRNTIYCLTDDEPDHARITESILQMIGEVQKYVLGYKLVNCPIFDGNKVSVFLEVAGLGDYLPKYAGQEDMIQDTAMTMAKARGLLQGVAA